MASNSSEASKVKRVKRTIKSSNAQIEVTLDEAFDEFIREKEYQHKAASTIRNYKQSYKYFYEFHEFSEDTLANEVERDMVYEWIGTKSNDDISEASLNHYLRDIRTFLYWCMEEPREYINYYRIKERSSQELKPKMIDEEDIEKLLIKPSKRGDSAFVEWRSYAVVSWILATGNRASTVIDVRMGDLDYSKEEITLHHTKNKKAQDVPFSPSLKQTIKEYVKLYRSGTSEEDYLFCNVGGDRLTYNGLRLAHTRYCESRGCSNTSLHSLRHTFAYNYVRTNGNVMRLQKILGHSSVAVTQRYVRLIIDDLKMNYEDHSTLDIMKKKSKRTKRVMSSEG